jgi:hypothetical protein
VHASFADFYCSKVVLPIFNQKEQTGAMNTAVFSFSTLKFTLSLTFPDILLPSANSKQKKEKVMRTIIILFALFLAACGGEASDTDKSGDELLGVSITDALTSDCPAGGVVINQGIDTNRNGKIDKDEISSTDTVCNGVPGVNGTSNKIAKSFYCSGSIPETDLTVDYTVDIFTSGDLFASAAVYGSSFEIGASVMYSVGQQGATTAPVFLTYDVSGTANGGYWKMALNRTTLVSSVEYNDLDVTNGKLTWSKPASECTVNNY